MNFKKLMLLPLLCCIHMLIPAAVSDDDSFWDDGWRTGEESKPFSKELPDLSSYDEAYHLPSEELVQYSESDALPLATATATPLARDIPFDRLCANHKPIKTRADSTAKAVVDDFFMCSECSYTTGNRKLFASHRQSHLKHLKQNLQSYPCSVPECPYAEQSLQHLIEHTQTDHQESIKSYMTP